MSPTLRFVPAMYAAALSARKTQTRRVITPQPSFHFSPTIGLFHPSLVDRRTGEAYPGPETWGCYDDTEHYFPTYGPPGTMLPIVTTWAVSKALDEISPKTIGSTNALSACDNSTIWFNDGTEKPGWAGKSRPAMFFPKSLYHLARQARVTAVKAERVQSISEADSIVEGMETKPSERWEGATVFRDYSPVEKGDDIEWFQRARDSYRTLWDSINAQRGKCENKGCYAWNKNPWVFATTFELV